MSLDEMTKILDELRVSERSDAILLNEKGDYLYTRRGSDPKSYVSMYDVAQDKGMPDLKALADAMTKGATGLMRVVGFYHLDFQPTWVVYGPVGSTKWSLGVLFLEKNIFHDLNVLDRNLLIISIAGLMILAVVLVLVAHRIAAPITRLAEWARRVIMGDLSQKVPTSDTNDESGLLSRTFEELMQNFWETLQKTQSAERVFEAAIAHGADGFVLFDGRWHLQKSNAKADALLGLPNPAPFLKHLEEQFTGLPRASLEALGSDPVQFDLTAKSGEALQCAARGIAGESGVLQNIVLVVRKK